MPVSILKQVISQRELKEWLYFLNNRTPDTTEIQLATIAYIISAGLGSKNAKVEDFLINKPPKEEKKTSVKAMVNGETFDVMDTDAVRSVFSSLTS